jgi:hypothetical protein
MISPEIKIFCVFSSHHLKLIALANVATQFLALAVNPVHSVAVR